MRLKNSPYKKSKLFLQIDHDTNNNGSPFRKVIFDSFKEARISSSPSPSTPCASSSIFKKSNTSKCHDILYDQTNEGNNSNLFELDDYNNSTTSCKLIGSRSNSSSHNLMTISSPINDNNDNGYDCDYELTPTRIPLLLTQKASASKVTLSSTVLLSNKENPDDISIDNDLPENLTLKTSNNYYYSNQSNYNDNNNYINSVNNSRCNIEPIIILDDDDNQKVKNKTNNKITDLNSFLKVGENNNKDNNVHLENLLKKPSSNQAGSHKGKLVNTAPKGFNLSKKSIQPLLNLVNGEPALKFSGVKKRQYSNMNIDKRRNFTVPKPFKFHGSNYKSATIIDTSPIIPLAERIKLFMERTPERYKSKVVKFHPTSLSHNQLTRPRSPNLLTKLRAQHIRILNVEENIFHNNYNNDENHQGQIVNDNDKLKNMIPKSKSPEQQNQSLPTTNNDNSHDDDSNRNSNNVKTYHSTPKKCKKKTFITPHHKILMPKFALPGDKISQRKAKVVKGKMRQQEEKEQQAHNFKYYNKKQPLQIGSLLLTEPNPFKLVTDIRGEKYQRTFQEALTKNIQKGNENVRFHATPTPRQYHNDMVFYTPKRFTKPPTNPIEFVFKTDTRVVERRLFDEERKKRDQYENFVKLMKLQEEKERIRKEVRRLRKLTILKARPIRRYFPIRIKPSSRKLTKPISPFIGDKRRAQMKANKNLDWVKKNLLNKMNE